MKEEIISLYEAYKKYVGHYCFFKTYGQEHFREFVMEADDSKLKAILESILKETQEEFDRYGDMEVLVYQTEFAEMLDCLYVQVLLGSHGSVATYGIPKRVFEKFLSFEESEMEAERLYELLDGKLSLKDCEKLSPYCDEGYYGYPRKGILLEGRYNNVIGEANVEYMNKQEYANGLVFKKITSDWKVLLDINNMDSSYIDSLVEDIDYMLHLYPYLDDDIFFRIVDELKDEAINDFLTRNFDDVSEEIIKLAYEYVKLNGHLEFNYYWFSEEEALLYIKERLLA